MTLHSVYLAADGDTFFLTLYGWNGRESVRLETAEGMSWDTANEAASVLMERFEDKPILCR